MQARAEQIAALIHPETQKILQFALYAQQEMEGLTGNEEAARRCGLAQVGLQWLTARILEESRVDGGKWPE